MRGHRLLEPWGNQSSLEGSWLLLSKRTPNRSAAKDLGGQATHPGLTQRAFDTAVRLGNDVYAYHTYPATVRT